MRATARCSHRATTTPPKASASRPSNTTRTAPAYQFHNKSFEISYTSAKTRNQLASTPSLSSNSSVQKPSLLKRSSSILSSPQSLNASGPWHSSYIPFRSFAKKKPAKVVAAPKKKKAPNPYADRPEGQTGLFGPRNPEERAKFTEQDWLKLMEKRAEWMNKASEKGYLPRDMKIAPIIYRIPVIIRDPHPWEEAYWRLREKIDSEKGVQTDDLAKEEGEVETLEVDCAPADRITEADIANDLRSLDRRLDTYLFLLARRNDRTEFAWEFPKAQYTPIGSYKMRQQAELICEETFGSHLRSLFYCSAPSAHYEYDYPQEIAPLKFAEGATVFYFFAEYYSGGVLIEKKERQKYDDYAWLTRDEIQKYLDPKQWEAIKDALPIMI